MKTSVTMAAVCGLAAAAQGQLILSGVIDGPRTGGLPKAVEFYAVSDIPDLGVYSLSSANNGAALPAVAEFVFPVGVSVAAGDYVYVASEAAGFTAYFGFAPDFTTTAVSVNGDDAIVLFENGVQVDAYGTVGEAPTAGVTWNHLDSYAYRVNGTGPSAVFNIGEWVVAGSDLLDSQGGTGVNGDAGITVPFGTFTTGGTGGLGSFGITAPVDGTFTTAGTFTVTWTPSANAFDYELVVARDAALTDVAYTEVGIASTSFVVDSLDVGDGAFFISVTARNNGQTQVLSSSNAPAFAIVTGNGGGIACLADPNNDGQVNIFDIFTFFSAFGAGCP